MRTLTSARIRRRFRLGRIALIFISALLILTALNQASIFVFLAPCNQFADAERQQYKENNATYYECTPKDGIIAQGIETLAKVPAEWLTGFSSALIALFTLTLWLATDRLWRISLIHAGHLNRSVAASAKAADAATEGVNIAKQTLVATHRPKIKVREVDIDPPRLVVDAPSKVTFAITNVGEVEAKIVEMYARIYIAVSGAPLPMRRPHIPSICRKEIRIRPAFIVGPFGFSKQLTMDDLKRTIYVMGTITYTDIYDTTNERARRISFCRQFTRSPPSFAPVDNPDYESDS